MPAVGTGSVDIRNVLATIVNVVKSKANVVCTAPCDGAVLKMHYRWTFMVLIGSFFTVWYQWYNREVITCVSHFDANSQVRMDYINICLSYPYILDKDNNKRYILYYRWVQWSFLVMGAIYYIPRKLSKNMENPKCKKLIEEFSINASRYDPQAEQALMEKITLYMKMNIRTHNGLYIKYLTLNFVALFIDILALFYFDFLLQGKFLRYGMNAMPFERDPELFSDFMSQVFPPFAYCTLDRVNMLVNERTETFGCHLTIMELYEKVFLFLWVWLIILTFITAAYIVSMLIVLHPKIRELWLRTSKPANAPEKVNVIIGRANGNCKIGDIYFMYRLKSHMSHARFYELLFRLGDPKLKPVKSMIDIYNPEKPSQHANMPQNVNMPQHGNVPPHSNMPQHPNMQQHPNVQQHRNMPQNGNVVPNGDHNDARNRKNKAQSIYPSANPDHLNQMYKNPDTLPQHGQVTPSGGKNNTSILIS